MKHSFFTLLVLLISTGSADAGDFRQGPWPQVLPMKEEIVFKDAKVYDALFSIAGLDGQRLYTIDCQSEEDDGKYIDTNLVFLCKMTTSRHVSDYPNLLTSVADNYRYGLTRGIFWPSQLVGPCGDYPDYGRKRTFRLRNMKLTLEIKGYKTSENGSSFRFSISAEQDPTAQTEIPAPSLWVDPAEAIREGRTSELDCTHILKTGEKQ